MTPQHDSEIARRLLLAKDFYWRGSEYSRMPAPIDRIVSIHHFHVAVEITAKAILAHYEIRGDRELNIDFESMLSQIDRHSEFQEAGQKLRYRQDLRNLNQARNLAQHHAHPPEPEAIEHWQKICQRFLEDSFEVFFGVDFWDLSRISYVQDETLRRLLHLSSKQLAEAQLPASAYPLSVAFDLATKCLSSIGPDEGFRSSLSLAFRISSHDLPREITEAIRYIYDRIEITDRHICIVGTGIGPKDLKRLASCTPHVNFSQSGKPWFGNTPPNAGDVAEVRWAHDFVLECILLWQDQNLNPSVDVESYPDINVFMSEHFNEIEP